jgi:hypothetical protein
MTPGCVTQALVARIARVMARASLLVAALLLPSALPAQTPPAFEVHEATIAEIHDAILAGRLTCRALVEQYLRRIDAFDKNGVAINAIIVTNPDALRTADDLDRRRAQGGLAGPLHCIPMIVKDNFETVGLQSANGSLALAGFVSPKDAFQVARVKAAGAIVLAKSNMAEWAFTPYETVSSILPGYTKTRRELRHGRAGERHRQFHPRSVLAPGARGHPVDDGSHESRRSDAAEPARRHRGADGANGRGCGQGVRGRRGCRPRRRGDGNCLGPSAAGLPRRAPA